MNLPECPFESAIVEADRTGRWNSTLQSHAAACSNCQEALLVAHALRDDEAASMAEVRLPPAGLLWWKAQIQARRAALQRAARPIDIAEQLATILLGVLLPILLLIFGPKTTVWTLSSALILVGGLAIGIFPRLISRSHH